MFAVKELQLTEEKLTLLETANKNLGITDPLTKACAEAESMVNDRTSGYTLTSDWHNRLVRAIAQYELYKNAGPLPDEVQKAYDQTLRELDDIRDGKYPLLAAADTGGAQGNWGSSDKVKPR